MRGESHGFDRSCRTHEDETEKSRFRGRYRAPAAELHSIQPAIVAIGTAITRQGPPTYFKSARSDRILTYSSFAFIVIFAFSTFDTGHPFSAASAHFWKVAASAPGTLPTTSM